MKFALQNLWKEKKMLLIYSMTICLSMIICYLFIAMLYDPYLALDFSSIGAMYMTTITTLLIVMFCSCLIIYTNIYNLSTKRKELALMRIHGMKLSHMCMYLFYQNLVIYVIFGIVGMSVGIVFSRYVILFLYTQLGIHYSVVFVVNALYDAISFLVIAFIISLIVDIGYVYRTSLSQMLSPVKKDSLRERTSFHLPIWLFISIYVFGVYVSLTTSHEPLTYIAMAMFGSIGIYGIVRYAIPKTIEKRKLTRWLNKGEHIVVYGQLNLHLRSMYIFVIMLTISVVMLSSLICYNMIHPKELYRMLVAYMIIVLFLIFCLTYKSLIFIQDLTSQWNTLYKIGITKTRMKYLLTKELCLFYSILGLFPLPYMIPMLVRYYIIDNISIIIIFMLLVYYICVLFISMFVLRSVTLKKVKEVK